MNELEIPQDGQDLGLRYVYYDSEFIEIVFTNTEGGDDIVKMPVLEYAHPTIMQLDSLVNGNMSTDLHTYLLWFLNIELNKIWYKITKLENKAVVGSKPISKVQKSLENKDDIEKLFVDEYANAYAAVMIDDHLEVFDVNSRSFKNWYRMKDYQKHQLLLNDNDLGEICSLLTAKALWENKQEIKLQLRTAAVESDWYYDLTNKSWEFVKITDEYWSIVQNEIIFKRYNNVQKSQVQPLQQYSQDVFDRFMKLVNIKYDDKQLKLLLKCYIVSLFIPGIQKPVLMLHGSQGAAKSTLQEMVKMLVDPCVIKTLSFPRDGNELIQQLNKHYVTFYDNISFIREYISDQLCRAVTGSGSSKRKLYSDDDDVIYNFKRCVGFNGINLAATKADLLDRGLIIFLERIAESKQVKPNVLWEQFEALIPELLGYIFDVLVQVLKWENNYTQVLDKLPRMSEFAEYGEVIARIMGYKENEFIEAYRKNIELQSEQVIDSSIVALAIIDLMDTTNEWTGTSTELLAVLESRVEYSKINIKNKYWPKAPNKLSGKIKEIEINLKQEGIEIEREKSPDKTRQRILTIRKVSSVSSTVHKDPNQARIDAKISDDTSDDSHELNNISSEANNKNHAQKEPIGRSDGSDDSIHISNIRPPKQKCQHCDYEDNNYDLRIHIKCAHPEHYMGI
jgi:hypothetical protein